MLKPLLLARRRHYLNFIRHHFDRPTLLILAGTGLLVAYQLGRAPGDIGISLGFLARPGFGRRWGIGLIAALPLVYAALFLLARLSLRRTPEFDLVRCLPVPDSAVMAWLLARHLAKTAPLVLLLALPALGDSQVTADGGLRAGGLLVLLSGLDVLALWHARKGWPVRGTSPPRRAAPRQPAGSRPRGWSWLSFRFPGRGGVVSALMVRDLSYLLRRRCGIPLLVLAAAAGEALAALNIGDPTGALTVAAFLQAAHALLQLGFLEALFERDALSPGLLKCLPVGGARLWRARLLLPAALLALPGLAPLVIGIVRGAPAAAWGAFLLAAILVVPIGGGLLFADVHVALFPRTRVATFLLAAAVVAVVLLWFFVPPASPLLAVVLLWLWGRKAGKTFDRMVVE